MRVTKLPRGYSELSEDEPDDESSVSDEPCKSFEPVTQSKAAKFRRHVSTEEAGKLIRAGWRQVGELDGLVWCVACSRATIWISPAGHHLHPSCED